jgi:uncharacterized protein
MEPVTYSLKLNDLNSESYYRDAGRLADEIMIYSESEIIPIIDKYIEYIRKYRLEEIRERGEYIIELLSFGVLWRIYSHTGLSVRFAPFLFMAKLGEWRKKHQRLKPFIDRLRGIMITLFLLPVTNGKRISQSPEFEDIDRVCLWFEATGEFCEQAFRLIRWRGYWETLSREEMTEIFSAVGRFTEWFASESLIRLGKYTRNVDQFISVNKDKFRWREDRISSMRNRLEYHLNMAGSELMNRAFKKEYQSAEITTVLLPGCMRFRHPDNCMAGKEVKGLKCIGCEPVCRVNQVRRRGLKNNYEVYIVPHATDLSIWSQPEGEKKRGVVASACVTTLLEGGWELKRYGIPAQCVLLDYSGCDKHWYTGGIPTELNRRELDRKIQKTNICQTNDSLLCEGIS